MTNPAPSLPLSAQLSAVLAKCAPVAHARRPRLQLCPPGWLCSCHAQAIVTDGDSGAWCASCGADLYGIDDLYAVTKDTDAAGEVLGGALDDFARGIARAQELAEYEAAGGKAVA